MKTLANIIISKKIFFLCFLSFSLPFSEKISTVIILILTIISCLDFKNLHNIKKYKKSVLLLFILYVFYFVSYWRDFNHITDESIVRKLSLIVFPLIVFSTKIDKNLYRKIYIYFVVGCFLSYLFYLALAIFFSFQDGLVFNPINPNYVNRSDLNQFYINNFLGKSFSNDFHPSYLSYYYLFSIVLIEIKDLKIIKSQALKVTITFFLSIGILQLGSILSIFILVIFLCIFLFKIEHLKFILPTIIGSLIILGFSYKEYISLNFNRIKIWETSYEVFMENPIFGHGYKTAQRELFYHYPKEGSFGALIQKVKIDAHNQFLQWLIEIGILGFFFASLILSYFILTVHSRKLFEGLCFFILIIMVMSIESIFNVFAGISFFSFFYCLVISKAKF